MARDAIARLYDVDKNSIDLDIPAGTIRFRARQGKSIDLDKILASFRATRLSGRTGMEVRYLELTAVGKAAAVGQDVAFAVSGTKQRFRLGEEPKPGASAGGATPLQRLRESLSKGDAVTSVTGRVQGWKGLVPDMLRSPPGEPGKPPLLIVTGFRTAPGRKK